jgi:crossover junction endodeoxyribonuclease RuvC
MTLILGIDPGSRITGFGIILEQNNTLSYIKSGCIKTHDGNFSDRLLLIYDGINRIMNDHKPQHVAIEQVFMHKNANAALKLGHARGVALVAAACHGGEIFDYSARQIKQAVVGYGAAEKSQIQHMVKRLLNLSATPQNDAADALAVAICHAQMMKSKVIFNLI